MKDRARHGPRLCHLSVNLNSLLRAAPRRCGYDLSTTGLLSTVNAPRRLRALIPAMSLSAWLSTTVAIKSFRRWSSKFFSHGSFPGKPVSERPDRGLPP